MKHAYSFIFLLLPFALQAQNWKTVSDKDTVYFQAGKHGIGYVHYFSEDSNVVKAVWTTSTQQVAGDSLFDFFSSVRSIDSTFSCIDTSAPSWLGPYFIRESNGTEYYFNSNSDTITIKTMAQLGDSWVLARATNGKEYVGTVTYAGLLTIDSLQDSIKTITIQAYSNNIPVADWYNSKVLQLSKDHGWTLALDLYRFPNALTNWEGYGCVLDSTQHYRLPASFKKADIGRIDFAWKYAAGNEWIEHNEGWASPGYENYVNQTVTHDSVISSMLTPNTAVVAFKTDMFSLRWYFQQGPPYSYWYHTDSVSTYYHTDTIMNVPSSLIKDDIFPELMISRAQTPNFNTRYFTDTFCGNHYLLRSHNPDDQIVDYTTPCWQLMPNLSGYQHTDLTYLTGFDRLYYHWESGENLTEFWGSNYFSYLKLANCTWGDYVNVLTLGVNTVANTPTFAIYPNPAKDKVYIHAANGQAACVITLYDITGRQLMQKNTATSTTEMPLNGYSPGIYILSVKSQNSVTTYKLQIE